MPPVATLIIIIALVVVMTIGVGSFILVRSIKLSLADKKNIASQEMISLLKIDLMELTRKFDSLNKNIDGANLKIVDRLERNNSQINVSVTKQLSESAKLVSEIATRLTKLDETNRRVVDVADELKIIQNVLSNPKQRGVLGEYYLKSVLENVLPPKNFQMQYSFKNGDIVDAAIFLDKNKILPVDSKFSLENYNRFIEAKDKFERDRILNQVKNDLKARIDETSKYIKPQENTMDFAFMFIPSESLYYDLLISNVGSGSSSRDLIEYAFCDKRVIIVSPTSFMAYLQTVLQGLRSLQIEEQAKDIQNQVAKLNSHIGKFDELMNRMGKSLTTTVNHYNSSYKELGKIDKDVLKIAGDNKKIKPALIDKPQSD